MKFPHRTNLDEWAESRKDLPVNAIPRSWQKHLRIPFNSLSLFDLTAAYVLADLRWWFQLREVWDPKTNEVRLTSRFKGNRVRRSYQDFADGLGLTKQQVVDALQRLQQQGLISLHILKTAPDEDGRILSNVLEVDLNVRRVEKISYDPKCVDTAAIIDEDTGVDRYSRGGARALKRSTYIDNTTTPSLRSGVSSESTSRAGTPSISKEAKFAHWWYLENIKRHRQWLGARKKLPPTQKDIKRATACLKRLQKYYTWVELRDMLTWLLTQPGPAEPKRFSLVTNIQSLAHLDKEWGDEKMKIDHIKEGWEGGAKHPTSITQVPRKESTRTQPTKLHQWYADGKSIQVLDLSRWDWDTLQRVWDLIVDQNNKIVRQIPHPDIPGRMRPSGISFCNLKVDFFEWAEKIKFVQKDGSVGWKYITPRSLEQGLGEFYACVQKEYRCKFNGSYGYTEYTPEERAKMRAKAEQTRKDAEAARARAGTLGPRHPRQFAHSRS